MSKMINQVLGVTALLVVLLPVVSTKKGDPLFYRDCKKFPDRGDAFECKTNKGMCVSFSNLCDSVLDCVDGSDEDPEYCYYDHEEYCEYGFEGKWIRSKPLEKWQCHDGMCIELCRRCDGVDDCRDGSDEDKRCDDKELKKMLAGVDYQCQREGGVKEL